MLISPKYTLTELSNSFFKGLIFPGFKFHERVVTPLPMLMLLHGRFAGFNIHGTSLTVNIAKMSLYNG